MKNAYEKDVRRLTIDCDCYDIEHVIRFEYWEDESDIACPEFYIHQMLNADRPFFNRLWNGIKYIFRLHPYSNVFSDTMISPHDVRDLLQFLQKYDDYATKNNLYRE
jgi:hypothetical protein